MDESHQHKVGQKMTNKKVYTELFISIKLKDRKNLSMMF